MAKKLSGKDLDIMVGDLLVHVENATLNIEDNTTVTKSRGIPNGWVSGDKAASGELELDTDNLQTILDAAKAAGSFTALDPFDVVMNAAAGETELRVEAFGCKLRISDLVNAAAAGGEKLKHKLPFDVTSSDFVRINGVPYVDASETENLV